MADIVFPFIEVSDVDAIFGFSNKQNFYAALKACPNEFFNKDTKYNQLFSKMFFEGLTKEEFANLKFRSSDRDTKRIRGRYLKSIMTSFELKHEDKEAVCAWLLSMIIEL